MPVHLRTDPYPAWLVWVIAIPIAIAAAFLAFFFLTFFLIAAAIAALGIGLRLWWLKRKLRRAGGPQVIEGEYRVVYEERTAVRDPSGSERTDEQNKRAS